MPATDADVLIAGLGPAGRALASRCAHAGLSVLAVDPAPGRRWTATYGAWADELPGWVPETVTAARVGEPGAWTTRSHALHRPYLVLDTAALQTSLRLDAVTVVSARVRSLGPHTVVLDDDRLLHARHVVDARGLAVTAARAQQTAFGVVTDTDTAAPVLDGRAAWLMDWRRDNGTGAPDPPSFLYAVPLDARRVLLEETCLAGRPALPPAELQRRLHTRLASRGVSVPTTAPVERVRFTVEPEPRRRDGVVGFGARGGSMHPATGYSVAAALAAADPLAAAMRSGTRPDRVLWPVSARAVAALRRAGLQVLLDLDPVQMPEFFAAFFDLPLDRQRAYLSGRTDLTGTVAAMSQLFGAVPSGLRGQMLRGMRRPGRFSRHAHTRTPAAP